MATAAMSMRAGVVLLLVLALAQAAQAGKEYAVDWVIPRPGDMSYRTIESRKYNVGDTLKFTYNGEMHNVVKVESAQDFVKCTMSKPSTEYADGMTSLTLDKAGTHFFICSVPGHCRGGMRIKVEAVAPPKS